MHMKKTSALIFDVDGTAIDSPAQKIPSQRLSKSIRAIEDTYYICAATGRPWPFAEPVLRGLNLIDPCIISGGTQICDPQSGEILWQCDIEPEDVKAVKNILLGYSKYHLIINDFSEAEYHQGGFPVSELDVDKDIFFIDFIYIPESEAKEIADKIRTIEGVTCTLATAHNAGQNDIHITNKAATKEHAVAELLNRVQVDKKNTYGFGDALNDVHLFRAVAQKIAMGNAVPELKELADEVIGVVSQDGLAEYFERLKA
jgi:Cof subfamily protein (haloacid dehalogenase superfamily)